MSSDVSAQQAHYMFPRKNPSRRRRYVVNKTTRRTHLCLELKIAIQPMLLILSYTCIAKLKDHFSEQYSPSIHIRHCDNIFYAQTSADVPLTDEKAEWLGRTHRHPQEHPVTSPYSLPPLLLIHYYQGIWILVVVLPESSRGWRVRGRRTQRRVDDGRLKKKVIRNTNRIPMGCFTLLCDIETL